MPVSEDDAQSDNQISAAGQSGVAGPESLPGAPAIERDIDGAIESVRRNGYFWAAWQPGVVAVATPLVLDEYRTYALNISVSSERPPSQVARELKGPLLSLKRELLDALNAA